MNILIIDNYDSFTYNLYQYVGEVIKISNIKYPISNIQYTIDVVKNDKITFSGVKKRNYDRIIISPGPGTPTRKKDFGISSEIIQRREVPILGVCLGHQGIGSVFGAKIVQAPQVMHGKPSNIYHSGTGIFSGLPQGFKAIRYHSLIADSKTLPECLEITAIVGHPGGRESTDRILLENKRDSIASLRLLQNDSIEIMGLRHKKYPIFGVQFHPESIGTQYGKKILKNFLEYEKNTYLS